MSPTTITAYLIHRLQELGVRPVFGVPGNYVLGFYKAPEESELAAVSYTHLTLPTSDLV